MKCAILILSLCLFAALSSSGQIRVPQTPTASGFQPVQNNTPSSNGVQYITPATSNPYLQEQARLASQRRENDFIRNEIAQINQTRKQTTPILIDTNQYKQDRQTFEIALTQLKRIAAHSNPSLAEAFYITENAYGNPYLTKAAYYNIINQSVAFLKTWMQQNNYNPNDNEARHKAIQKFMSEKLSINKTITNKDGTTSIKTTTHQPFFYDYIDNQAKDDHRNFFLTKILATGGGQCNSMPMVYLVLAEKIKAKTFLTFAPQHAFIKYLNNGEIENYEPTSNWHINDLWYQEHLFISPEAIRSRIYLDTLSKHKIVANCMIELAIQYTRKMPIDDSKFLKQCLWEAYQYYPEQNNINSYFIYSSYLKGILYRYLQEKKITQLDQIEKDEYAFSLQKEYQKNEAYIKELGYRDMPEGMYEAMLKEDEFKGRIQQDLKISGKQKRNLFIETNQ